MLARITLILAGLVWAACVALTLVPARSGVFEVVDPVSAPAPTEPSRAVELPIRAVGMQIHRTDWIDLYVREIDAIAELGADAVKLVVAARQENGSSTKIYLDLRKTPNDQQLSRLIRHAKSLGLRVILMPIVLIDAPRGNEWRGTLKPDDWDRWFNSYRDMLSFYCWVAQRDGVDLLVVGSELLSSERHEDQWRKTIAHVRRGFDGMITYSANWDHYTSVGFWDALDLVGMNSYWKLGDGPDVTPDQIARRWQEIARPLLGFVESTGKPLIFLEVGWCSMSNAAHEPWDYTRNLPVDLDLQRRLYQGFFETWHGHPLLAGYSVWEWAPEAGGPDDRGYTPRGKPAEAVLRHWLAKPPWTVGSR